MDADGRAWRNRRRLSISRAAGQQGQDCCDRKDSADFHGNLPSSNGIRRPTHTPDDYERGPAVLETHVSGETCGWRLRSLGPLLS